MITEQKRCKIINCQWRRETTLLNILFHLSPSTIQIRLQCPQNCVFFLITRYKLPFCVGGAKQFCI